MTRNQSRMAAVLITVAAVAFITMILIPFCCRAEYPFVYLNGDAKPMITHIGPVNVIATMESETLHLLIKGMPEKRAYQVSIQEVGRNEVIDVSSREIRIRNEYILVAYPQHSTWNMVVYFDNKPAFMIIRR